MIQHTLKTDSTPASAARKLPRRPGSLSPSLVFGAVLRHLHQTGSMRRPLHPLIETIALFVAFVEKRHYVVRFERIRTTHVKAFVNSPVHTSSGQSWPPIATRMARYDAVELFFEVAARLGFAEEASNQTQLQFGDDQ